MYMFVIVGFLMYVRVFVCFVMCVCVGFLCVGVCMCVGLYCV